MLSSCKTSTRGRWRIEAPFTRRDHADHPPPVPHLLILENDRQHAERLCYHLEAEGYQSLIAPNALDALHRLETTEPDLFITDDPTLVGPIRHRSDVPLLLLATPRDDMAMVRAFLHGADDWLPMPVGIRRIKAHILAILRRVHPPERQGPSWVQFGEMAFHPPSRSVRAGERTVRLTRKECALLQALIRNRGRAVPRDELLRTVWHQAHATPASATARTVDTHVSSLRRKLARTACAGYIFSIRKTGYGFRADLAHDHAAARLMA
jgi:DNA-binding response OmpR family regulator